MMQLKVMVSLHYAKYAHWAVYSLDRRVSLYAREDRPLFMRRLSCR